MNHTRSGSVNFSSWRFRVDRKCSVYDQFGFQFKVRFWDAGKRTDCGAAKYFDAWFGSFRGLCRGWLHDDEFEDSKNAWPSLARSVAFLHEADGFDSCLAPANSNAHRRHSSKCMDEGNSRCEQYRSDAASQVHHHSP